MLKLKRRLWKWRGVMLIASGVGALVLAGASAGLFQLLEWATIDLFFRLRPQEPVDSRIVIVTIDESDIDRVGTWPLSDAMLAKLIANIKARNPRAIGIDIYRNLPVEPGYQELLEIFKSTPNLIGIEKVAGNRVNPSPALKELGQLGFADVVLDKDGKVRRGLLSIRTEEGTTKLGISAKLALMYLGEEGINLETIDASQQKLRLGQAIFIPFKPNDGIYVDADAGGYQILLNFRGGLEAFKTITLTDVLANEIPPDLMENKIVLVGAVGESLNDFFLTPHSSQTPGVVLHANLLSQILSGALEGRDLIKFLPEKYEWFWIVIWSFNGASLSWFLLEITRSNEHIFIKWTATLFGILLAANILFWGSYLVFLQSWWFPVISPLLGFTVAAVSAAIYHNWRLHRDSEKKLNQFLEALPIGVAVLDRKGQLYYTNKTSRSLFGQGAQNFLNMEKFLECNPIYLAGTKDLYPAKKLPIMQALQGDKVMADDLEIIQEGRNIPIESMGTPITDELGNIIYAIATFQDISERRKIEAERDKYTEDLFKLNKELEDSLDNEFLLNDACGRFVPHQFLSFLGYESIVEVKLGDAVQKEMSILFSDIRSFTNLSETMTPDDNFKFINGYLKRMEPAIENNNGFIDKYIGDAIMALFGGTADDAVKAGINMLQLLNEYNTTRQRPERPPISIGIGINTGSLILGIVGGANRISGTVISDAVNLASRIESLTKVYGVSLLISHNTFLQLNNHNNYKIRLIDKVQVKGKLEYVTLFEVFDADSPKIRDGKLATRNLLERAILCYNMKRFKEGAFLCEECLKITPWDKVPRIYLERCQSGSQF
jgi:PAS domain S-box-containing protein